MARSKAVSRRRHYFVKRTTHRTRFHLPLAIVAGFVPPVVGVWNRRGSATDMGNYIMGAFTGLNPDKSFNAANLREGLLPVMAGFLVHTIASKVGLNRAIARTGIPIIRI